MSPGTMAAVALAAAYEYRPFRTPAPLWDHWYLLAIPICAAIAVVYKCVRCRQMCDVPRQAVILTGFMLAVLVVVAVALAMLVWATE